MRRLILGVAFLLLLVAALAIPAVRRPLGTGVEAAYHGVAAHLPWSPPARIAEQAEGAPPERAAIISELSRVAEQRQSLKPTDATRARMHELLRRAAAMMAGSEAMGSLRDMQEARGRLRDLDARIADGLLAGHDVKELQQARGKAAVDLTRATDDFARRLTELGVPMTPAQAEMIAIAPNGDDMVALLGMQANVAHFVTQLRETVEQNRGNTDLLRRYYGLNVVLCEMVETLQTDVRDRIRDRYLPRLAGIEQENLALQRKAEEKLREASGPERDGYAGNLRALQGTAEIMPTYRRYLAQQGAQLDEAIRRTQTLLDLAANTASTMENTAEVLDMVNAANRDVGAVINLVPPGTLPLDSDMLRQEFERLSRKLSEPTS
ncbi:hypothetical protein [Rhodovastum atsumiense]|uniref:Uncharacterized protein n=1 Tax=Rhodovastum atsumiense TaxID=504468 RepID=A0A5M6IVS5_9PROT|nr:hypothetical protein [Rhodovastum atsumiense]KAA5611937.1 hypothetical protein F1189_11785 [Rhodovastum atsumiense]